MTTGTYVQKQILIICDYLKSMVTDNPKTQKRIMGKNNSEVSLSDVDYDQISLSRLEDQKYEICCT